MKNKLFSFIIGLASVLLFLSGCNAQNVKRTTPIPPTVLPANISSTIQFIPTSAQTETVSPTLQLTPSATPYLASTPLWRFGVALVRKALTAYDSYGIASMRFGWYVDFKVNANAPTPYGMEYVPTVRVKQLKLAQDGTETEC